MLVVPDAAMVNEAVVPSQTAAELGCGEIVIVPGTVTVKLPAFTVLQPTVTLRGPEVAPTGTVTVSVVAVDAVMIADTPLNETVFENGVLKFVPVIVTELPIAPESGAKEAMVGGFIRPTRF